MSGPAARRALFVCDGAVAPPAVANQAWTISRAISTRGDDPVFPVVLEGLARKVIGEVRPRARDLIRIAACCFAADLQLPRGGIDVDRVRWRREFALYVTVEEPAFWAAADVVALLAEALGFLTEDTWRLCFQQGHPADIQLRTVFKEEASSRQPDTVVLFSGGSDSLCALVDALRNEHREPVVVSHWPARHIRGRQDILLHAVEERFAHWDIPHASFEIHRRGREPVESSQRTRGFLYACLGAAIAAQHGVTEVRLADNGYVSVNPPISDQLVGALASRGTHPKFLYLANRFLARVFPEGVHLVNPLWNKTRAEALQLLAEAGCADLLALTYTCGKQQGHPPGQPLCGGCSQCVDRRIAAIAAGLEDHDPPARYEIDLFGDELPVGEPRTIAVAFVRFADQLSACTPDEILNRLPQLDDCFVPDDPEFKRKVAGIPAMLGRHAQETVRVVAQMVARARTDGTYARMGATALLPLWMAQHPAGAPAEAAARFGVRVVSDASSFLRAGGTWVVKFRGQTGHFAHTRGMTQLTHLLEHPKQLLDILALDDCRAVAVATKPVTFEGMRAGFGGDPGEVLTPGAEEMLTEYQKDLPGRIQQAQAAGDREEVKRLREEAAVVKQTLRAARNLRGERRRFGGPEERARKNVSRNIHRCYALFAGQLPKLVAHALRFVHLAIPPCYDPDPPERWTIER